MSFLSKLKIDGMEYAVLEFNVKFFQDTDVTGRPSGVPKGGNVKLIIESSQDASFLSWMINTNLTKDGEIIFYKVDAKSKMRSLIFKKAYCINYEEQFSSTNNVSMRITMEFVAKSITFGTANFVNNWIDLG